MTEQQEKINFDDIENLEQDGDIEEIGQVEQGDDGIIKEPPVDDTEIQHLKLLILEYRNNFKEELEVYGDKLDLENLDTLSLEQLKKLSTEVEITVGTKGTAQMIPEVYYPMMGVVENLGSMFSLKLHGLQMSLMNNKNLKKSLVEVGLKYGRMVYLDPIKRVGLYTMQTIMAVHYHNDLQDKKRNILSEKVSDEICEEFKNI